MQASSFPFRCAALVACILRGSLVAQAQSEPIKFGQIDKKDLTAESFVADSAAEAVVLCDYGRAHMEGHGQGFQVVFERVTRIKILKKAGYDEASVEIPLYHRDELHERLSSLRGITYNLVNGAIEKTKLADSGAFLEKQTPNVDMQKFTLPNVRVGSVIEYAYMVKSDFLFTFQNWAFQQHLPVRWSEYRVSIPAFYKYKIIYQGYRPLNVDVPHVGAAGMSIEQKLDGTTTRNVVFSTPTEEHRWVLQDAPAFRAEPYMTTEGDYLARVDFQLVGEQWPDSPYRDLSDTWPKINYRLLDSDDFGKQMSRGGFLKDQMQALASRYPAPADRAAAVREALMANMRYSGVNRYGSDASLRKAYEAHRGTAAEVNLLLIAALREAGLPAQPVLLSTRDHGRVDKEYPLLDRFNYVVALVPVDGGADLLVDATEPLLPCGVLPERCLNKTGRLIPAEKNAEGRWVDLTPSQRRVHYQQVSMTLDAQGGLSGKVHEEHGGYAAADARAELAGQGEKAFLAGIQKQHESWTLTKMAVGEPKNVARPLTMDYEFSQPATDATTAGTLYLSPLAEFATERNPFQHEARNYAVDFGVPQEETVIFSLTLPAGYELAETPKPAVVDLPGSGGRFVYSAAAAGPGKVQLTSRLTLNKTVYPAEQYANLRELFRLLLGKQAEKLVIRKKA